MGEVYRARDTRLGRVVAIKVLPSALAQNTELRLRLEPEARSISKLSHPHICTLYDIGNQDGTEFLVLEYLEGETLERRLGRYISAPIFKEGQSLRRPVVRSGDAAHRPGAAPRLSPFASAESLAARASPSPTRDAFAIGDSNPRRKRGCDGASFHGTRSHGPGIPAESNQSPARCRLAARASAARTAPRECPCLAPVLGSQCQRWRPGRAAG